MPRKNARRSGRAVGATMGSRKTADFFAREAKKLGYAARSALKLKEFVALQLSLSFHIALPIFLFPLSLLKLLWFDLTDDCSTRRRSSSEHA